MDLTDRALDGPGAPTRLRPLEGTVVRALGDSTALGVAASRLRGLGCTIECAGPAPLDAPAGMLRVVRAPFVPWGAALPTCRIGWSGPVEVPMASELDVQAACGIMQVHGRALGGSRALRIDFASTCAGVLAAQAVMAGFLAALRGRRDVAGTTSVAQAAVLALTQYIAVACTAGDEPGPDRSGTVVGRVPPFDSADGVRFEIETFDAERWLRFWTGLGAERAPIAAGWPAFQQRFATATCVLPLELGEATASVDYPVVRAAAVRAGVSMLPIRAADGPLPEPGPPWRLRPLGEAVAAPPYAGTGGTGPLGGVRVLESTSRVQGPLAGHVLGLLGADVVRLEPPGGDPQRGVPPLAGECSARFLALNRGKGVAEADLKSPAGRRAALRLAASVQVFLHNWAPGRAARFGLDAGDLATVQPSLVYAHTGGWAEALPEPQPLGTDYLVQAHAGVAAALAGPGEPPAPTLMTITDVLGALIGAEGVVAGLLARARTGTGVGVESALMDAARLLRETGGPVARDRHAPVVTDLATMAADPAYAALFDSDGATTYSRAPWTFEEEEPE